MTFYRLYTVFVCLLMVCFINIPARADEITLTTCDFATLKAHITELNGGEGGSLTFDCAGTIRFTEILTISTDITITSADNTVLDGYGEFTLFQIESGASLTLDSVTIQTAWTAIQNEGTLTISNSLFRDNQAYSDGAVIVNDGTAFIGNSQFIGNETDTGGAIVNSGDMTITDSTFSMNKAYRYGGAIYNSENLTIENSHFAQNLSDKSGGAIHNAGYLSITNSTFDENTSWKGGAILDNQ
ncbi:MAG TPA: right-handed parallel beta-helix repeat-containing protein, partial [Aggregatilineales bacterium]|nr:right-handed parallel beta-helix repeat-containing protein [Aggregatilineales bacterium]